MEAKLYHVDPNNFIVLVCPSCQISTRVSVAKFRGVKHTLATKCKCGFRFQIQLNFRKYYRKNVQISGQATISTGKSTPLQKIITISDLSMTGLRFKMPGSLKLKTGDILKVEFDLKTKVPTTINKEVIVRYAGNDQYGCEFKDVDFEEKGLGFFLMGG